MDKLNHPGRRLSVGLLATIGAIVAPASAGAAQPGDLCRTVAWANTDVFQSAAGRDFMYRMPPNTAVRIVGYAGQNHYKGHSNGQPDGYFLRLGVDQATCQP